MGYSILVLCTANVGRSPLGEAILRARLAEALGIGPGELEDRGIVIRSAGTRAWEGWRPSSRSVAVAAEWGIDLGAQRSTRVTEESLEGADRVFCMDAGHLEQMAKRFPAFAGKGELLDPSGADIPDPKFRRQAFFADVRDRIASAIDARLPALLEELGDDEPS